MGKTTGKILAPSILSADFSRLGEEIRSVEKGGADWIHVDVMDGHFVPNLTIGPPVVKALRPVTKLPLDCHLMVSEPWKWVEPFRKAGADCITIHLEAAGGRTKDLLGKIRSLGGKAGLSIKPATSVKTIEPLLPLVDLVLVMSVEPGFGGQSFLPDSIGKVKELALLRERDSLRFLIEIDGGIDEGNIGELARAGVDAFVAGSAVFRGGDPVSALKRLRDAL